MSNSPKDTRRQLFTRDAKYAVAPSEGEKPITLSGYAAVWNTLTTDGRYYAVRFKPNSAVFAEPTHAYFHHDPKLILASTANGSLRLSQDNVGIKFEMDLPNTQIGRDVAEMVKTKLVSGMSFGQRYDDNLVEKRLVENDKNVVEIEKFTCDEITVTATPAFAEPFVAVKDEEKEQQESYSRKEKARLALRRLSPL